MKALLVSANAAKTPYPVYPLGMSMVGAAAEAAGHDVTYLDLLQNGMSLDALGRAVRESPPDVVGISIRNIDNVNVMHEQRYIDVVRDIVERLRRESAARIVLGGSAFSILPERILEAVGGDCGVVGEGEQAFVRILDGAAQGRFPPRGAILRGHDLLPGPAIPSPRYHPDILAQYLTSGSVAPVQTKRGCPLRCAYCSYPALEGRTIRARDPRRVVDDMVTLIDEHAAKFLFLTDSVFNDAEGTWREVLREMERRGVRIPWSAFFTPVGITADDVTLMKATGLRAVEIGTDASCDETLKGLRKPFTWAQVVATNDMLAAAGVSTAHYVMFGGPGETPETVRRGIGNLVDLKCSAAFVFMGIRILPDTALFGMAVRERIIEPDLDLLEPVYYFSPGVDREWLEGTLTGSFKSLRHIVFPPDAMDDRLQMLHRLGYTGTLWELLAP